MLEVRIPKDKIPADILERLQAIANRSFVLQADGKSKDRAVAAQTTALTSQSTPSSTYGLPSHSNDMTTHVQSSSQQCQDSSEIIYTTSRLSLPSPVFCSTSEVRTRQRLVAADEVDGGPRESVLQINSPSQEKRQILDALDHSGIVSIFPAEDISHSQTFQDRNRDQTFCDSNRNQTPRDNSRNLTSSSNNHSEIVRIFPDVDDDKHVQTHFETTSQNSSKRPSFPPRPRSIHLFGKHLDMSSAFKKEGSFHPAQEVKSQSPMMSSSQQFCTTPPGRTVNALHCEAKNSPNIKPSPSSSQLPSRNGSEHKSLQHVTTGRSPELPTPPQTPDDLDDEVFTYNQIGSDELLHRISASETKMRNGRSPSVRESVDLRRYSDRSHEMRHHMGHGGVSQQVLGPTFGDRQKTRKRLSFDEEMPKRLTNSRSHHHSDPTVAPPQNHTEHTVVLPVISNSKSPSLNEQVTSRQFHSSSPTQMHHRQIATPTFSLYDVPSVTGSVVRYQPSPRYQTTPTQTCPSTCLSRSPPHTNSCTTGDDRVDKVRVQTAAQQRTRLHSEGDSSSYSRDAPSSKPKEMSSRSQTFSYGKRRREGEEQEAVTGFPPQVPWSETDGDCTCSKIARNFLNMAEGAYRSFSQMDGTQAGLGRFREELAQTNDILMKSLAIVQQFQVICKHSSRPSAVCDKCTPHESNI